MKLSDQDNELTEIPLIIQGSAVNKWISDKISSLRHCLGVKYAVPSLRSQHHSSEKMNQYCETANEMAYENGKEPGKQLP